MQSFLKFLQENPGFVTLIASVSGFLGLLCGHWLAIGRDRRREFNEVAQRIRPALLRQRDNPTPHLQIISAEDADLFLQMLPFWKRRGFTAALKEYEKAKTDAYAQDAIGQAMYKDTTAIKARARKVLSYTKMR